MTNLQTPPFPYYRVWLVCLLTLAVVSTASFGQSGSTTLANGEQQLVTVVDPFLQVVQPGAPDALLAADKPDSLVAKRHFFTTTISQKGVALSRLSILEIVKPTPRAQQLYNRSHDTRLVGPILMVTGLAIGYLGIQGKTESGFVRGIRTPTNYSPPDIPVEYTNRNLPMLLGGIGLLVGGICMVEISNSFASRSVNQYNSQVFPRRLFSLHEVKLGITKGGRIGLEARF